MEKERKKFYIRERKPFSFYIIISVLSSLFGKTIKYLFGHIHIYLQHLHNEKDYYYFSQLLIIFIT